MQHTKNYIVSEEIKEALGHLYREIEQVERRFENKIDDLERKITVLAKGS